MIVKNDMKKVTLLIPVYNEEAMLPTLYQRLIELVNRNAVYEWEILFVNDGSSDTTLECLRRLRQQDKRVNYAAFQSVQRQPLLLQLVDGQEGICDRCPYQGW